MGIPVGAVDVELDELDDKVFAAVEVAIELVVDVAVLDVDEGLEPPS